MSLTNNIYFLSFAAIVLNIIDIATTIIGINHGYIEGNAVMNSLIQNSLLLFFSIKIIVNLIVVSMFNIAHMKFEHRTASIIIAATLVLIVLMYVVVVVNNLMVLTGVM